MNNSLAHLPRSELHSWRQGIRLNRKSRTELYGCVDGELMPRRLQQLGLDPEYVKVCCACTYQDLERVCASCKTWRRCARDLAKGDVQSGMGSYCLNAPTIDAWLLGRPPWDPQYS